ncbi:uncharacterized protein LOC107046392 [Diachasma alloeum]|uniref:uncharacterized protein LOC107046392 n=1 Tax=Diachasma alloeum TaxID=454923 RepID=UPI00073812D3|nr:uncharacterized protein LOC107046392 [Diachasma alloeum]
MNRNDKCWFQCHASSPPITSTCQNDQLQTSQNNFFQNQQQTPQSCNQTLQPPLFGIMTGTQPSCLQSQPQCQSDAFSNPQRSNLLTSNAYQQPNQGQPSQMHPQLSPALLEQIRTFLAPSSGPIFILPTTSPTSQPYPPALPSPDCPGVRSPCGQSQLYQPPPYYPYPMPMPILSPFVLPNTPQKLISDPANCSCCSKKSSDHAKTVSQQIESDQHFCSETDDDTVCSKRNCPSAINLQALTAQLLAVPGVISCAATRMILRKISGSNVSNPIEEIMERSQNALNSLAQEQLLTESRNAQQVGALINLHMTANPPANIVPILTATQLKVNVLKGHADSLITRRLSDQGIGADGSEQFDVMILGMKSDEELRQLLVTLRQKECDERVNLSFAPYRSQRIIAETRLRNVESKIRQVEKVMEKRRFTVIPRDSRHVDFDGSGGWHAYPGSLSAPSPFGRETTMQPQTYDSPDPFHIEVRSPRRLNLKPHVGSPETTYERELEQSKEITFGIKSENDERSNDRRRHINQEIVDVKVKEEDKNPQDCGEDGDISFVTTLSVALVQTPEKDTVNEENEISLCHASNKNPSAGNPYASEKDEGTENRITEEKK